MTVSKIKTHKCERCHKVINKPFLVFTIPYYKDMKILDLCEDCYSFMISLFDSVIEEYILRKE